MNGAPPGAPRDGKPVLVRLPELDFNDDKGSG